MSVLYKALQKAEKENEQRQSAAGGKGFDPQRIVGSGAIKLAGARANMRLTAVAGLALLVVVLGAVFLVVTPKLQQSQQPQVATVVSPPLKRVPTVPATERTPQTTAPAPQAAQAPTTPTPSTSNDATRASAAAAPIASRAAPAEAQASTTPLGPAAAASQGTTQASAAPAQATPASTPASAPKEGAEGAKPAEAPQPKEVTVVKAEPPRTTRASAIPVAPQKPVEIPADSPAQMLNPPISIARSDFALEGVGRAVQVREISQQAQDDASAGYTALLRGEYDTALGFYGSALKKEPTSVLAMLGRGAALQKLHRLEEAQAEYTKVLKADPQNREALTNVTAIISERQPAEALNRLLDLEKEYPAFSPITAEIGLIYAKMGTMDPALEYLRRAVALSPESVMYQYNLALVLDHMGLAEQAVQAYQNVLSALATGNGPPELSSADIERRVRYLRVR